MNAELHGAFVWDCDDCGRENFVRATEANLDEPVAEAAAGDISCHYETVADEDTTDSPWLVSRVLIAPLAVTCVHCGRSYTTELPSEDE